MWPELKEMISKLLVTEPSVLIAVVALLFELDVVALKYPASVYDSSLGSCCFARLGRCDQEEEEDSSLRLDDNRLFILLRRETGTKEERLEASSSSLWSSSASLSWRYQAPIFRNKEFPIEETESFWCGGSGMCA